MATAAQQRAFYTKLWPYCLQCAKGTGLSPCLFLCQWADETEYGTCTDCPPAAGCNNYSGINGTGCDGYQAYSSLSAFANGEIAVLHQSNFASVLAAAGESLHDQMIALGSSPWAGSHYNNGSGPGSVLWQIWEGVYSSYGLDCQIPSTSSSSPPPPVITPLPNVVIPLGKASALPGVLVGLLLVGGGAAISAYVYHTHPPFRDLVHRDLVVPGQRAEKQGVIWLRALGREADKGVAWVEDEF